MICAACPHPADCAAGRCIDMVAAEQIAQYGSPHHVRIMRKDQTAEVLKRMQAGALPRGLAEDRLVNPRKLFFHGTIYTLFGVQIASLIVANTKAMHLRRMAWKKAPTHCKHGHEMTPENTARKSNGTTQCKTCKLAAAQAGKAISAAEMQTIRTKLSAGIPLGWIAGTGGPGRTHYVANFAAVNRARREHPDFDAFVADILVGANSRGQARRYQRVRIARRRDEANDYTRIRSLIPAYLPDHVRDDIAQSVMLALLEGTIRRHDVNARISRFVTDHNRMFPTKYAKFGDAPLLSLDAAVFDDSNTTRGDMVSEGLWQ